MEGKESVTALLSRLEIVEGESVMDIREAGRGADLDIFCEGSRRERMRLDGTEVSVRVGAHLRRPAVQKWVKQGDPTGRLRVSDVPIRISGRGKVVPYCRLKESAISRASSRCCC